MVCEKDKVSRIKGSEGWRVYSQDPREGETLIEEIARLLMDVVFDAPPVPGTNSGGVEYRNFLHLGTSAYIGRRVCTGDAAGADVRIDSGYSGHVYGGYVGASGRTTSLARDNSVSIRHGVVGRSGHDMVVGGYSTHGAVTGNVVNVSGGAVSGEINGGNSAYGDVVGNVVNISGGVLKGGIIGGCSHYGSAMGNRINISGSPCFDVGRNLLGGRSASGRDSRTGNSLVIATSGLAVGSVSHFQHFSFILDDTLVGKTVLSTDKAVILTPDGKPNATVSLFMATNSSLAVGDSITLLSNTDGSGFNINGAPFIEGINDTIVLHEIVSSVKYRQCSIKLALNGPRHNALTATVVSVADVKNAPGSQKRSSR